MMSSHAIERLSREAEARAAAAAEGLRPYVVWPEDLRKWKAQLERGEIPSLPFPFIGEHNAPGFTADEVDGEFVDLFVDMTGVGGEWELALTIGAFVNKLQVDKAYALVEVEQFQAYVRQYSCTPALVRKAPCPMNR